MTFFGEMPVFRPDPLDFAQMRSWLIDFALTVKAEIV